MAVSVLEPVSPAIERTRFVLFRPFDLGKWLGLGFCAFLAALGSGGGGGGGGNSGGNFGGRGGHGPDIEPAVNWIRDNLALIATVVVVVIVLMILLGLLLIWLSSRGKFMLLDGVVRNRGAVVEPWREFRREGNSLLAFRFCFGLLMGLIVLILLTACAMLAWVDVSQKEFGLSAVLAIVCLIIGVIPIAIVSGVVSLFTDDFVVPTMYLRRIRVIEAWGVVYRELLRGRAGTFVLYVLFKIVIAMIVGALSVFAVCCTCCCAAVPYVGSVILLPLTVFMRCYSLYFIEQFGPNCRVFPEAEPEVPVAYPTLPE